jgi:hypothetical protein
MEVRPLDVEVATAAKTARTGLQRWSQWPARLSRAVKALAAQPRMSRPFSRKAIATTLFSTSCSEFFLSGAQMEHDNRRGFGGHLA